MMKEYTLIPLQLGKILLDKSMMTCRMFMGERIEIPYFSWYIRGADKNILVDTGISAAQAMKHSYGFLLQERKYLIKGWNL